MQTGAEFDGQAFWITSPAVATFHEKHLREEYFMNPILLDFPDSFETERLLIRARAPVTARQYMMLLQLRFQN